MEIDERYITTIVVDLGDWTSNYPTGCIMYHYDQVVDSAFCENAGEFIEYIRSFKAYFVPHTKVKFVFDMYDVDNSTVLDCAREIWKAVYEMID